MNEQVTGAPDAAVALQELITAILRRFADAPVDALDATIDEALSRIGSFAEVDRSYIFIIDGDGRFMTNTHEWCASGIEPQIDELQRVDVQDIHSWLPLFERGEPVYVPRVSALPEDRSVERELLSGQGIQSLITMPLTSGDRLIGFLGFDAVRSERPWSYMATLLLRAVADVIVGGLSRRDAQLALSTSEERFRALVQHSSDLVLVLDADGGIRFVGPSVTRILGWKPEEVPGRDLADLVHHAESDEVLAAIRGAAAAAGADVRLPDHRLQHADGTWHWFLSTAVDLTGTSAVDGIVVNSHDITERKSAEAALRHQALHDPLTGLPNRMLLMERLQDALVTANRSGMRPALVFIDVDRFKMVNDSLGHHVGDELLIAIGRRLGEVVRTGDVVARFGGDEFLVLIEDAGSEEDAVSAAHRLLSVFSTPFALSNREHYVTASAGVVLADGGGTDPVDLVRDADAALYQAKERGRARVELCDRALQQRLLDELELAHDLHRVLEHNELDVAYQPLFDLGTGAIMGTEALLRWRHPRRGMVSPATFIPLAEENGLIVPIGGWVLARALQQLRAWSEARPELPPLTMTVNLSVRQLTHGDLPGLVATLLARHEVAPRQLCLELTESILMAEPEAGRAVLGALRDLGVRLAIDDFGTGHSSFAYLRNLPVTALKIDRSFVTGLGRDVRDSRVVAAIIGLAHEFGLTTVAEGVETIQQLAELRALGCDVAQGYYLLPPGPPSVLTELRAAVLPGAGHIRGTVPGSLARVN